MHHARKKMSKNRDMAVLKHHDPGIRGEIKIIIGQRLQAKGDFGSGGLSKKCLVPKIFNLVSAS